MGDNLNGAGVSSTTMGNQITLDVDAGPRGNQYTLHAVLVHSGGVGSGHYWVCARIPEVKCPGKKHGTKMPPTSSSSESASEPDDDDDDDNMFNGKKWQWYKFDDTQVTKVSAEDAMDRYFGYNYRSNSYGDSGMAALTSIGGASKGNDPLDDSMFDDEDDDLYGSNEEARERMDPLHQDALAIDDDAATAAAEQGDTDIDNESVDVMDEVDLSPDYVDVSAVIDKQRTKKRLNMDSMQTNPLPATSNIADLSSGGSGGDGGSGESGGETKESKGDDSIRSISVDDQT